MANKRKSKKGGAAYKKVPSKKGLRALLILVLIIAILFAACFAAYKAGLIPQKYVDYVKYQILKIDDGKNAPKKNDTSDVIETDTYATEEIEIYFPYLNSYYAGDCTLIKVGNVEVLIDAGPRVNCIDTIENFIKSKCTDNIIEYVIVTHADRDHIACFATKNSLFNRFEIGTIIGFSQVTDGKLTGSTYLTYLSEIQEAQENGVDYYTAKELRESGNYEFSLSDTVTMTVLDNKFYYEKSSDENNHSVCTLFTQECLDGASRNFLFTGDLEKEGEEWLAANVELPKVELFKAGHHGSKTSSNDALLQKIQPEIVCVCCCAGTSEYTSNVDNQFPTQAFIDRVSVYTARVYVTTVVVDDEKRTFVPLNGTITVISFQNKVSINGSENNTVLKDTEWFKKHRTCPPSWTTQ